MGCCAFIDGCPPIYSVGAHFLFSSKPHLAGILRKFPNVQKMYYEFLLGVDSGAMLIPKLSRSGEIAMLVYPTMGVCSFLTAQAILVRCKIRNWDISGWNTAVPNASGWENVIGKGRWGKTASNKSIPDSQFFDLVLNVYRTTYKKSAHRPIIPENLPLAGTSNY